ncbi:MAG TPA: hypothetical protein DEG26_11375 [Chloroflexi bacterium]|nr:hypothetical protein [Chloroflexota bacterium]
MVGTRPGEMLSVPAGMRSGAAAEAGTPALHRGDPVLETATGGSVVCRSRGREYLREVGWIHSGPDRLYASLYAARTPAAGVVVLPHWGRDGRLLLEWCHRLALGAAHRGGCGVLVQWPGNEDSEGGGGAPDLDRLVEIGLEVLAASRRRFPTIPWSLAGVRLGAVVAALAADSGDAAAVVLVQPELDLQAYFDQVARAARLNLVRGDPHPGWGFRAEIPAGLGQPGVGARVHAALGTLSRPVGVVRYAVPPSDPLPGNVLEVTVPGSWLRPPGGDHRPLRHRALGFLSASSGWR